MTEAFNVPPQPMTREARAVTWRETNPKAVAELREAAKAMDVVLTDQGYRSGDIIAPVGNTPVAENKNHFANSRQKAVVLGHTLGSTEPNVVVHFPTKLEAKRHDATFVAYQSVMGEYLRTHWDTEINGMNPMPGIVGTHRMEDGRYVAAVRFRKNFEPLGAEGFATGIHVLNTSGITPSETRRLVHVLDAMHADAGKFQTWAAHKNMTIPPESWLHPENAGYAYRGQEWWVSPTDGPDRLKELTSTASSVKELYTAIDPGFDVKTGIASFIKSNIGLYPHTDGRVDDPKIAGDAVVVHGSLYPDNIHMQRDAEGKINFTVSGGDRAQGYGLRGQMIDWLVTGAAGSPKHQEAMIDEFIKLHPSDKDRRGLAMHVLYRSILETPWFVRQGKMEEAKNLATLTHDIVTGKGVWNGTNTPLTA